MKIIVVGGGKLGEAFSKLLAKERHDVVLIENKEELAEELADRLDALVLYGDGSDRNLLKDANIESADAVVAITGDDKTNLAVCEIAKNAKVPNIVARVNQQESERVFAKLGVTSLVDATATALLAFKKLVEKPGKQLVSFVAGSKGEIFEISIRKASKFAGKGVSEVAKDFTVACIYRDDKMLIPKPETRIKEGDILTLCAPVEEVKKIEGML
jgi:trk system potassium uptake protein TrkA